MNSTLNSVSLNLIAASAIAATAALPAFGQYDAFNVTMYEQITLAEFGTGATSGNDCWGYVSESGREYALMGMSNAMAVVEITDPANPVIIDTVSHTEDVWCDIKVFRNYAYAVNEESGGMDIVDLSDVDNGNVTLVRRYTGNGLRESHNIAINEDSGYLYLSGSNLNGGRLTVFDLNADPTNPTYIGVCSSYYSHDAHIITYASGPYAGREIAFSAGGTNELEIWDVTDKGSMTRLSGTTYDGLAYCHQAWTSEDGQYLFVNDELDEYYGYTPFTRTLVFDISDLSNPVLATTFTTGETSIDHNLYVLGNYVFEANYTSGLHVFDVSDPLNAFRVAYFDTYPGGNGASFDGAWSTYPYFPSGTVIVSDIQRGLFILDVSGISNSLEFIYPDGRPDLVDPAGGTTMRVEIHPRGAEPDPGSGLLHVDTGDGFIEYAMVEIEDNVYDAVFPASTCGDYISYYLSAETTDGLRLYDPPNGEAEPYQALSSGDLLLLFVDDFETDTGWTVENISLTDGAWERGLPAGDGSRGDPTTDFDGSGRCVLTGNRSGNSDVDGGPTRLTSPLIDLSGADDALVSYARWFFNDDNDIDRLDVEVSNNDGQTWHLIESVAHDPRWQEMTFTIGDYVTPTAEMRFRFSATDNPNDSVTEGALDAFTIYLTECDRAGLLLEVSDLFAGEDMQMRVSNATNGERVYFAYSLRGEGSTPVPRLNVTLDLQDPALAGTDVADSQGVATLRQRVPLAGQGRTVWFQAAEFERTSNVVSDVIN